MTATPPPIAHGSAEMVLAALAETLERAAAHAAAGSSYARAENVRALAREVRSSAACLLTVSDLMADLEPAIQQGGRAA